MRTLPGKFEELQRFGVSWSQERGPNVHGAVGSYVLRPDANPDEALLLVIFDDKASYQANADDPEQHTWYLRMRDLLVADPEWTDGEILAT
jgi:hypothetical protein